MIGQKATSKKEKENTEGVVICTVSRKVGHQREYKDITAPRNPDVHFLPVRAKSQQLSSWSHGGMKAAGRLA